MMIVLCLAAAACHRPIETTTTNGSDGVPVSAVGAPEVERPTSSIKLASVPQPGVVMLGPAPTAEQPAPPTTTVPSTTTTVAPAVPSGATDAAWAATSAGARTTTVDASGIHVGPGQAYPSIASAASAAPAGSTIVIHDNGDAYRESFTSDGWLGKQLHFVAAPGERPVVSGADVVTAWTTDGHGRWFHAYVGDVYEFDLPVENASIIPQQIMVSDPNAGLLEQVFVDGQSLVQQASLADLVPGSFYVDRDADRVYLADDPSGHTVEVTSRKRAVLFASGAAGSSIEGLTITAFSPTHTDGRGMVVVDRADDIVLRDVVLSYSSATALLAVRGDRLTLDRVSAISNGARGMSGDRLDELTISRSRFEHNNRERFDYQVCGSGTYCVLAGVKLTRSTNVDVTFSDFSDNQSTGFWCDLSCSDLVFVGNHAANNARHGAYFEVSERATIEANLFVANGDAGVKTSGSRDVRIAHNTFMANSTHINIGADYRPGTIAHHTSQDTHMRNIDVVDNVFAEDAARLSVIDPVNHDWAPNPWSRLGDVENNVYLLTDSATGSSWRFRLANGHFELSPAVAADPAGVYSGDPLGYFVDPAGDFRLVGSPAALVASGLSVAAASYFPALGDLPPGAPLG
ncbi:MAG: right-handed parallel beta-helix repeat-containing protein [Actinomycetota bacterium]